VNNNTSSSAENRAGERGVADGSEASPCALAVRSAGRSSQASWRLGEDSLAIAWCDAVLPFDFRTTGRGVKTMTLYPTSELSKNAAKTLRRELKIELTADLAQFLNVEFSKANAKFAEKDHLKQLLSDYYGGKSREFGGPDVV